MNDIDAARAAVAEAKRRMQDANEEILRATAAKDQRVKEWLEAQKLLVAALANADNGERPKK